MKCIGFGRNKFRQIEYPVILFFLIAAPAGGENVHLEVLSRLSRMLMDDEFHEALMNAKTPEEYLKIINEAEKIQIEQEEAEAEEERKQAEAEQAATTAEKATGAGEGAETAGAGAASVAAAAAGAAATGSALGCTEAVSAFPSKPVAITVTRISSSRSGSNAAPKIIFASS